MIDVAALIEERAEHLRIFHRQIGGAAPAHAEPFDAARFAVGEGAIGRVDVGNEFVDHHGFRHEAAVAGVLVHG